MSDVLLVNITWNPTGWRNTYINPRAGHEYARQNAGHESLNFKFDKRDIDTEKFIHGFVQWTNPPTKFQIALISIATQGGATQVSMASTMSAPTAMPTMPNTSNQGTSNSKWVAEHYILGYTEIDLAAKPILETCKEPNCYVRFIKSLDELPDDWYHLTGNVASATANLPDGCRTKQDLVNLQVIYMVANNYTPCP